MRIQNYNAERAEKSKQENDAIVQHNNKIEKIVFYIKSILLIIMSLCVIAMCVCVIGILITEPDMTNSPILLGTILVTGCSLVLVMGFLITRKKPKYLSNTHYDNMETKYHRLNTNYKVLRMDVDEQNNVACLCEDSKRCVSAVVLKPKLVKTSTNIKAPVLDVQYDCLWLPA